MDKYYRKVPPAQLEPFMRFRREHPPEHFELNGITWEYLTSGNPAGQPLLLFTGALSTAESSWRTLTLLDQAKYRLICPSYPPEMDTMSGLADGIAALLAQLEVQSTYVVGGSYGGMLAQVFTRRHPDLVSKLVLSHTYPPVSARAHRVTPAMRMFKVLPMFLVKKMLRDRMIGILPSKPSPELLLVAAQVRETVDTRLTRQAALNTFYRMMDFDNQAFSPADMDGWPGKTLIMLASDDPTTPESLRKALLDLYPGARLHLFKGSGHATSILESNEYIQVLESFLAETVTEA
jgi:pimeloyl-ACP methyl ester carboxylesterase